MVVTFFFFNLKVLIKDQPQQEEQETMRSKDTEIAAVKLPRCLGGGVVKVEFNPVEGGLKNRGRHRHERSAQHQTAQGS